MSAYKYSLLLFFRSGIQVAFSALLSKEEEGWIWPFFGVGCRLKLATALLTCFLCAGREWVWKLLCLRLWLSTFPSEALSPASWGWGGTVHNGWCKPALLEMWSSSGFLRNSGLCSRLETAVCYQKINQKCAHCCNLQWYRPEEWPGNHSVFRKCPFDRTGEQMLWTFIYCTDLKNRLKAQETNPKIIFFFFVLWLLMCIILSTVKDNI